MNTTQHNPPLAALRHHVTGAIERGEAQAILEMRPSKRKQQQTKRNTMNTKQNPIEKAATLGRKAGENAAETAIAKANNQ